MSDMNNFIEDLKTSVSIIDVVSRYRPLHKAGKNFKALCPFHDDHSPSMIINPSQNFAWCFVCQNGGDIFSFIQKIEGIDFFESVKIIAEMAGVDGNELSKNFLKNQTPEKIEENKQKKREKREYEETLRDLLEETRKFFLRNFEKNKEAQKYVFDVRKFLPSTQKHFSIGYAEDDFYTLQKHLLSKKFSRKQMLDAGVIKQSENNSEKFYDRFRNRIVFPFFDSFGKICGFGGRILGEGEPKYLNSPETQLYDKSKNLFGFSKAKEMIRKKNMAVLVEGNLDVMTCHEYGITLVVGVSGVGFSLEQARLLKRFCTRVTLALDADNAGMKATERIVEVLFQENFSVRILELSGNYKDPDEAVRGNTKQFVKDLLEAQSAISVIVSRLISKNDISKAGGKRKIFDVVFPLISKIPDSIEKNDALKEISFALKTDISLIEKSFNDFFKTQKIYSLPKTTKEGGEISLLDFFWAVLFAFFSESGKIFEMIEGDFFLENEEKNLYEHLQSEYNMGREFSVRDFLEKKEKKWRERIQKSIVFVEDKLSNLSQKQRKSEISKIAFSVGRFLLKKRIKECSDAFKKNPTTEIIQKLQFFQQFLKKFHSL